jgi:hypothetical protein
MTCLDGVRNAIRVRHYSYQTERTYLHWVERLVRFHKGPGGCPTVKYSTQTRAVTWS